MIVLKINPVPKPRMTRADTWKHRPVVDRYFAFKDVVTILAKAQKFKLSSNYKVEFLIEMPKTWSDKKRRSLSGKPHQQRPDLDNLVKALNDCLLKEDSVVWNIEASKIWWDEGQIIIYNK